MDTLNNEYSSVPQVPATIEEQPPSPEQMLTNVTIYQSFPSTEGQLTSETDPQTLEVVVSDSLFEPAMKKRRKDEIGMLLIISVSPNIIKESCGKKKALWILC